MRICGPGTFTTIQAKVLVMARLARKRINRTFIRGPPGSPEKKTREEGRSQKVLCACMRDARTDYNDEPGTDLELAKVN